MLFENIFSKRLDNEVLMCYNNNNETKGAVKVVDTIYLICEVGEYGYIPIYPLGFFINEKAVEKKCKDMNKKEGETKFSFIPVEWSLHLNE